MIIAQISLDTTSLAMLTLIRSIVDVDEIRAAAKFSL